MITTTVTTIRMDITIIMITATIMAMGTDTAPVRSIRTNKSRD